MIDAVKGYHGMTMEMKERIQRVYTILDTELPKEIGFLHQRDPFRFLISVILSAQTTDRTVNQIAVPLFERYPDAENLAAASVEEVESIIFPTGFFHTKARNIIACSKELVGRSVPDTMEELLKLPGVGRKTANCVLGDIYKKGTIIVDTHFSRVVNRLGFASSIDPKVVERQIIELLEESKRYRFSMTVNLFGRTVCHARKPECATCILSSLCPSRDAFLNAPSTAPNPPAD